MIMLVPPISSYSVIYDGDEYSSYMYGQRIASNAEDFPLDEWDSTKTDYKYRDKVKISTLNAQFVATVDNPKGYPVNSPDWFEKGLPKNYSLDRTYTTKGIYLDELVEDFDTSGMSYVVGEGIENVNMIEIYELQEDDKVGELLGKLSMTTSYNFECFNCCSIDFIDISEYFFKFPSDCRTLKKIRVKMTPFNPTIPIRVSTHTVAKEFNLGCLQKGAEIGINFYKELERFEEIRDIAHVDTRPMKTLKGVINVPQNKAREVFDLFKKYGGKRVFYAFDELDFIQHSLMLGSCERITNTITGSAYEEIPINIS